MDINTLYLHMLVKPSLANEPLEARLNDIENDIVALNMSIQNNNNNYNAGDINALNNYDLAIKNHLTTLENSAILEYSNSLSNDSDKNSFNAYERKIKINIIINNRPELLKESERFRKTPFKDQLNELGIASA